MDITNHGKAILIEALADVAVEVFPPRLLGVHGLYTADVRADDAGNAAWTSTLDEVTLTCTMMQAANRLEITAALHNEGDPCVLAVRYPSLCYRFPLETQLREFDPVYGGVLEKRDIWVERYYPGDASLCASFVAAPGKALGIALRNERQLRTRIYHLPGASQGQMSMEIERVAIGHGETIELPSAYVAWGDHWGDVLRPYREWILDRYPRQLPLSSWYWNGRFTEHRYGHCLAPTHPIPAPYGVWVFDNGQPKQTLDEVFAQVDEAFVVLGPRGLQPLFYQFGWWKSMETPNSVFLFDAVCGDYDAAHALVKPTIDYIHDKGGRTFLYTNFISAGEDAQVLADHPELFVHDAPGRLVRNASYPMFLFCPGAPGMREYWDRTLQTILIDLDADGVFLDQLGGATPTAFCYDPAHRHAHPDTYGRDYLALLDYVAHRARSLKPDCLVAGELTSDIRAMWVDQMHGVGYASPRTMTFISPEKAASTPPAESFAFMSFINPAIAHLPSGLDFVARGCPGTADIAIWQEYRDVFRAGLQPCVTEPIGAMAYLFGPVDGQAILATMAWGDIPNVTVSLPTALTPASGGTHLARPVNPSTVLVDAGCEPRFYRLVTV